MRTQTLKINTISKAKKKGRNGERVPADLLEAENVLQQLAGVFGPEPEAADQVPETSSQKDKKLPDVTDIYRVLVEQIPAVVFIAFFDKSFGEAYISPQIEATLGYTQEEWLRDPVRWYQQIHPEDKARWSVEAAQMFSTGEPLRSVYRVLARDGSVIWFHCEVKMIRHPDGRPWFIHGIGFDITELKHTEEALIKSEDMLREYAERMEILSRRLMETQEAERRIIALELHDQIGQMLTGLKLKLEMLTRSTSPESKERLNEAQTLVNELIGRTRELSLNLRPATLDHLGLLAALLRHFKHYTSQTNVQVDFQHTGLEGKRFTPELETAVFRIVQEALTNIARHSGADRALVRIWSDEETLSIQIEDQGRGFEVSPVMTAGQSSGLTGMRERALLAGGHFTVESDSAGTRLSGEWNLATLRK